MIPSTSTNLQIAFLDLKEAFQIHCVYLSLQYITDLEHLQGIDTYVRQCRGDPPSSRRCFYNLAVVDYNYGKYAIASCCSHCGPTASFTEFHHLIREQVQYLLQQIRAQ